MRRWVWFTIGLASAAAVIAVVRSPLLEEVSRPRSAERSWKEELASGEEGAGSLTHAMAQVMAADAARRIEPGGPAPEIAAIESRVDGIPLDDADEALVSALGGALPLRRLLLASRHPERVSEEDLRALRTRYLADFAARREESVPSLIRSLESIPVAGFPAERRFLLLLVADLPGARDEALRLASSELSYHPDGGNRAPESPIAVVPITAHAVLLGLSPDGATALAGTTAGIASQSDPWIRRALYSQFSARFPNESSELTERLAGLGIDLSGEPEPELAPDPELES